VLVAVTRLLLDAANNNIIAANLNSNLKVMDDHTVNLT
jgi:hypothetical protein